MRIAALLVALFAVTIGVFGIVSPDSLTAVRRQVFDAPNALYVASAVRVTMGLVLILAARRSWAPKTLSLIGAVMSLQGIVPQVIGIERGRAILEQESAMGASALRLGALIALATGVFIAVAVMHRSRPA